MLHGIQLRDVDVRDDADALRAQVLHVHAHLPRASGPEADTRRRHLEGIFFLPRSVKRRGERSPGLVDEAWRVVVVARARVAGAGVRVRVLHRAEEVEGSGRGRGRHADGEDHCGLVEGRGSSMELQLRILFGLEADTMWTEDCTRNSQLDSADPVPHSLGTGPVAGNRSIDFPHVLRPSSFVAGDWCCGLAWGYRS